MLLEGHQQLCIGSSTPALLAPIPRHQSPKLCSSPICCRSWLPNMKGAKAGPSSSSAAAHGSDGSGPSARPPVSQAHRIARQVQDHQPLSILARLDHGIAVRLRSEVAEDGQRTARPRLHPRLPAHVLSLPVRQTASGVQHHLCHAHRGRDRHGGPEHRGGDHRRTDRPHGRHHRSARRISADPARNLRQAQHSADIRRDHHRHRPHRQHVRRPDFLASFPMSCTSPRACAAATCPARPGVAGRNIADAFWGPISENPGFVEGHTFEGNPISCAAGLAVLNEIIERDLCSNARIQGANGCARACNGWPTSTASSATFAARGCSWASSS